MASDRKKGSKDAPTQMIDEPGWAERFQRGLRNLINTPPKPRKPAAKSKKRPAPKRGVQTEK